jgi:hypothetical protein
MTLTATCPDQGGNVRPRVEPGVIWYRDATRDVIVNTCATGDSPLLTAARPEIDLLPLCDGSRWVSEIARHGALSEGRAAGRLACCEESVAEMFSYPGDAGAAPAQERSKAIRILRKLAETMHAGGLRGARLDTPGQPFAPPSPPA